MMLAVYALRERALLLGLQPTKGASTLSLPETKPTPRPRVDAAETMLPLTEDLPELALVRCLINCTVGTGHMRLAMRLQSYTVRHKAFIHAGCVLQLDQSYTLDDIDEDDPRRRVPPASAAAAAAAAAAAVAAVAALDPSKPLPKVKARSHKKKKPEELLANMTGVTYNGPT